MECSIEPQRSYSRAYIEPKRRPDQTHHTSSYGVRVNSTLTALGTSGSRKLFHVPGYIYHERLSFNLVEKRQDVLRLLAAMQHAGANQNELI